MIDGLNITLKGEGSAILNVTRDSGRSRNPRRNFVDAYNNVFSTMAALREGDLAGDSTLRSVERLMRGAHEHPARPD